MIFVDFPDDTLERDNPQWPLDLNLVQHPWQSGMPWGPNYRQPHPKLMEDAIDAAVAGGLTGKKYNITTYFRDMSHGKLNIVGHVAYQQARYPFYSTPSTTDTTYVDNYGGSRTAVATHVIEDVRNRIAAGQLTNIFWGTDSWNNVSDYNHLSGNDNFVDMVIICYRNQRLQHPNWSYWNGLANDFVNVTVYDGTTDSAVVRGPSLIQIQNMKTPYRTSQDFIWHEIGHLFGLIHQYSDGMWSVMVHGGEGMPVMNSWERWRLGWLNYIDYDTNNYASADGDTLVLGDLPKLQQAVRIKLRNATGSQYLFLEHHAFKLDFIHQAA
jgi:M6 family metalloprotease-like protein